MVVGEELWETSVEHLLCARAYAEATGMDSIPSEASGSVLSCVVVQVVAEVGLSYLPPKNTGCQ